MKDYWNAGSDTDDLQNYFSSVTCAEFFVGGVEVTDAYDCGFVNDDRVQIEGGFMYADVPEGTVISIRILGFRNPIATNVEFDEFEVYTTDEGVDNFVDFLDASVMITEPADLTGGKISVSA